MELKCHIHFDLNRPFRLTLGAFDETPDFIFWCSCVSPPALLSQLAGLQNPLEWLCAFNLLIPRMGRILRVYRSEHLR
jgi:hypothetical protein